MNFKSYIAEAGKVDTTGWVEIGDIGRKIFGQQNQYFARHFENPDVVKGLRVHGNPSDYHSWKIHPDDKNEFVKRVEKLRKDKGIVP